MARAQPVQRVKRDADDPAAVKDLIRDGPGGGRIERAEQRGRGGHYTANIDTEGYIKLWRPGHVIAVYPMTILEVRSYHLKVVANGSSIKVYVNSAQPVIDAIDSAYSAGHSGQCVQRIRPDPEHHVS